MLWIYMLIGAGVWVVVALFNYGLLAEMPSIAGIIKLTVDKKSFTGSANILIDQLASIVKPKNKDDLTGSFTNPNEVINYIGFFVTIALWPVILLLAIIRHSMVKKRK